MVKNDELSEVLSRSSDEVARRLLGTYLVREYGGETLIGKIVETEAYDQTDAASHSYHGMTNRTQVMFGPPGHLYVYFSYGMHYCCNVVCGPVGHGSAVLIRALEPLNGLATMQLNRHGKAERELTNGPAKVCQALAIDFKLNGHDLRSAPLLLLLKPAYKNSEITTTTRVGITKAKDELLRFYIDHNKFVSRPL